MEKTKPRERPMVTMQDVASELGVSKMTVSFALNGTGRVSAETRQTVVEAARRMGFEPNPNAQRLRGWRPKTICLFSLWLDLGVGSIKLQLIQNLLKVRGFDVPLHGVGLSDLRDEASQVEAIALLRRQKPRAVVATMSGLRPKAIEELQQYQDEGGILVAYDSPSNLRCDQVVFDREHNSYMATRHLLELGHREIGIGFHGTRADDLRYHGYERALLEFGVKPQANWCLEGENAHDYALGGANLAQLYMNLKKRPTAMLIINDYSAMVFIGEVHRAGLKCPEDVSVVGHDDYTMSRYHLVSLTTASHPTQKIAECVVDFLLSRMDGKYDGPPRQMILRGDLTARESSQPLK